MTVPLAATVFTWAGVLANLRVSLLSCAVQAAAKQALEQPVAAEAGGQASEHLAAGVSGRASQHGRLEELSLFDEAATSNVAGLQLCFLGTSAGHPTHIRCAIEAVHWVCDALQALHKHNLLCLRLLNGPRKSLSAKQACKSACPPVLGTDTAAIYLSLSIYNHQKLG